MTVTDRLFKRTWQSALIASCFSLTACGGGGGDGGRLQTIAFAFPGTATLGIGAVKLTASATSGLPVEFTSGTPEVCTVSGGAVTPVKEAQCLVIANQPGGKSADGSQWAAADPVNQVFNVVKGAQLVEFVLPNSLKTTDSLTVPLGAKAKNALGADSGMPITYTVGTPAICSISGSNLVLKGKGLCTVTASQAGGVNYTPAETLGVVAVDPVLIADGFDVASLGAGKGSTNAIRTKQGGGVSVNAWHWSIGSNANGDGGWENCNSALGDWCYQEIPADGSTLNSALHTKEKANVGWDNGSALNRVDIFLPGVTSLAWGADTAGGKQVTTEASLVVSVGVSDGRVATKKPLHVELVLSKNGGNDCNVTLSAALFPAGKGMRSYAIPLDWFATTKACGTGAAEVSLDTVRGLPFYEAAAPTAFLAELDKAPMKPARTSAATLLKTYPAVQLRIRDHSLQFSTTAEDSKKNVIYNNDLKVGGFAALL